MPRLAVPNEVLMEICRFCTYNDLNALALTSRQVQVSSDGFSLHYSPDSPRTRLFSSFGEFADCARKEDCFLRKVFSAEVYSIRTNLVHSLVRLRFYCKDVMYHGMWKHDKVCELKEDRDTLLHPCHTLKIECFEDPEWKN
uniref:F-box domain-containing protein n=1 Tax=Ditylenchus dipsaci TaxID=166011 RepID=A0A915D9R4_9BILA